MQIDFDDGAERPYWAQDESALRHPIGTQHTPVTRRLIRNARIVKALLALPVVLLVYGLWRLA